MDRTNIDLQRELLEAIKAGDDGALAGLLTAHAGLANVRLDASTDYISWMGYVSEGSYRPLHIAAFHGRATGVELLLDAGAEIEALDTRGWTALHWAARSSAEVVDLLLDRRAIADGASVIVHEDTSKPGETVPRKAVPTPLLVASGNQTLEIALTLLDHGANIDAKDAAGQTRLHYAVDHGTTKLVAMLVERGAAVDVRDREGTTPLHLAARKGHREAVELLLDQGAAVNARNKTTGTPLHEVASTFFAQEAPERWRVARTANLARYIAIANSLLDHGADVHLRSADGWLPIGLAIAHGFEALTDLLRRNGSPGADCRVEVCVRFQEAIEAGDVDEVRRLLDETRDLIEIPLSYEEPRAWGITAKLWCHAMHVAARARRWRVLRLLLSRGAPVDVRDGDRRTALHLVAMAGNVAVAKRLLALGANSSARGYVYPDHRPVLNFAVLHGHHALAALLLAWGVPRNPDHPTIQRAVYDAAQHADARMVKLLLAHGAGIRPRGPLAWLQSWQAMEGAVMPALRRKDRSVLDVLLSYGANLDESFGRRQRPLHEAAQAGDVREVSILLELGMEIGPLDREGRTPLHLAAAGHHARVVGMLLAKGADPSAVDRHGESPLHAAVLSALCRPPDSIQRLAVVDTIGALTAHGERADRQNASGISAVELAEGSAEWWLMEALSPPSLATEPN